MDGYFSFTYGGNDTITGGTRAGHDMQEVLQEDEIRARKSPGKKHCFYFATALESANHIHALEFR